MLTLLRDLQHLQGDLPGHHDHAVVVAEHQVTGLDIHTADDDGVVDPAGAELRGGLDAHVPREHGELQLLNEHGVADRTLHHQAGCASGLQGSCHHATKQAARLVEVAVGHHDHLAGTCHGNGFVEHHVVADAALDRQRRAAHTQPRPDRTNAGAQRTILVGHGLIDRRAFFQHGIALHDVLGYFLVAFDHIIHFLFLFPVLASRLPFYEIGNYSLSRI